MPVLLLLLAQSAPQQSPLDSRVRAAIADFSGAVSLFAKNLDSGASYGVRENERVRTASTVKLPIMAAAFAAVAGGRAKWSEELVLHEKEKISGSGILREFSDGVRLTLRDALHLMIVVSDNTATNLVLDKVPADAVNNFMDTLGLTQTRALRKVLGQGEPAGISRAGRVPENQRFGLGVTTPREMVLLLEKIERGEVVSPEASREMIAILKRQQDRNGIGRHMAYPVASKSGALERLRSDIGIVYTPHGRIAIAITCDDMPKADWSPDNPGLLLMSKLAGILVELL